MGIGNPASGLSDQALDHHLASLLRGAAQQMGIAMRMTLEPHRNCATAANKKQSYYWLRDHDVRN